MSLLLSTIFLSTFRTAVSNNNPQVAEGRSTIRSRDPNLQVMGTGRRQNSQLS
jgi:hypothetical protein